MSRRPTGTGSIFRRGKVWYIQYYCGHERHRENAGSEDRKVAEELLVQRLAAVATGQGVPLARVTVGTLIDLVLADYDLRGLKSGKVVAWVAAKHFGELRKIQAAKFGMADIQKFVASRRREAENATINRELAILRRGFELGRRADPPLVHRMPYILHLEEDNARQGFLQPEQYERLLTELPDRLKALFVCAYHVGTRKGELRHVRWEQVDFESALIRLEKGQTKGKRPRTLPIYGDMERWLRTQQETCLPGCQWVFHYRGGMVGDHLEGWHEACGRAGLPGLLFHDLRRSAARNMQKAKIPRSVAMSITGHKTESMWRRYAIVNEEDLEDAGKSLERYFEQRKAERAAKLERVK